MTGGRAYPEGFYVTSEDWGHCMVCGNYDDRRFGACFDCADYVMTDGKKAWDIRDEDHAWNVPVAFEGVTSR